MYVRKLSKEQGEKKEASIRGGREREREVAYVPRRKLVGNCASRNADADTGNPYDRLWLFMSGVASESEELKGKEDSRRWELRGGDGDPKISPREKNFLPFSRRAIPALPVYGTEDRLGDAVSW